MVDLVPESSVTSRAQEALYFVADGAVNMVSGAPVSVARMSFDDDDPQWRVPAPWEVDFDPYRLRRQLHELRRNRNRTPTAGESSALRAKRFLRDGEALLGMFGRAALRVACRLPVAARPFCLMWVAQNELGFSQLFEVRPAFAVAIVDQWLRETSGRETPAALVEHCRSISRLPLPRIAEFLGFPPESATGLSKVAATASDPRLFGGLRSALTEESLLRRFNHTRRIGPSAIRFFARGDLRKWVSPQFLSTIGTAKGFEPTPYYADLCADLIPIMGMLPIAMQWTTFRTPRQLESRWQRVFTNMYPKDAAEVLDARFPPAPAAGLRDLIEQIRTGADLLAEADAMRNCLFQPDYVRALRRQEMYLFSAGGGDLARCTIKVRPVPCWDSDEPQLAVTTVLGRSNQAVSRGTLLTIERWAHSEGLGFEVRDQVPDNRQLQLPMNAYA